MGLMLVLGIVQLQVDIDDEHLNNESTKRIWFFFQVIDVNYDVESRSSDHNRNFCPRYQCMRS